MQELIAFEMYIYSMFGLDTVLQVVTNSSSLPIINIPAQLTPLIGTASQTDNTSLVASIGAIATSIFGLYQNNKDTKKADNRTQSISAAQLQVTDSLKATDMANKEDSTLAYLVVNALAKHPEMQKILDDPAYGQNGKTIIELATEYKQGWDNAIKQYYDTKPRIPGEYSKDPVVAQSADVLKVTAPTPAP